MPFTGASALLTQLQTQIDACASWTGSTSDVHYPELTFAGATFPAAVVSEEQRSSEYYASGAAGLRSGTLKVAIFSTGAIGATEVLGQAILEELLAQQSGIPFRSGYVGMCGDATDASIAAATEIRAVEIFLEYGLSI